jgi:hypothetical protein
MTRPADHASRAVLDGPSFALAGLALIAAAAVGALAVFGVPGLAGALYPDAPKRALGENAAAALALLANNAPVALWPLCLVGLGWHEIPVVRLFADGLIAAQLAVHGASVGAALAAWPDLLRWLSHLPVEWSALALPCGAWIAARRGGSASRRSLAVYAALTVTLLALAAALETWAAPA